MFAFVIVIHVLACALLIILVMIQQGKGGGLIDSLSSAESIFGTRTNTFLIKATSVLAVVFFLTCLGLAFLSIQQNKSLIDTSFKPRPPAAPVKGVQLTPIDEKGETSTPVPGAATETLVPAAETPVLPAQTPAPEAPVKTDVAADAPAAAVPAAPAPEVQAPVEQATQPTSAEGGSKN